MTKRISEADSTKEARVGRRVSISQNKGRND